MKSSWLLCHVCPVCVYPHGMTRLSLDRSSCNLYRPYESSVNIGRKAYFILLGGEPKPSSSSFSDTSLALAPPLIPSSLSRRISSFVLTRSPAAAMFIPHCIPPPVSSPSCPSCMALRPVLGPWPPHCRDYHGVELRWRCQPHNSLTSATPQLSARVASFLSYIILRHVISRHIIFYIIKTREQQFRRLWNMRSTFCTKRRYGTRRMTHLASQIALLCHL